MVDMERRTVLAAGAAIAAGLAAGTAGCQQTPRGGTQPGSGPATIKKSEVPVGGGVILKDKNFVVTQPVAGEFVAFVKICPHAGCAVTSVDAQGILCACHNSRFDAKTGARTAGPAKGGLGKATVTAKGDTLEITA